MLRCSAPHRTACLNFHVPLTEPSHTGRLCRPIPPAELGLLRNSALSGSHGSITSRNEFAVRVSTSVTVLIDKFNFLFLHSILVLGPFSRGNTNVAWLLPFIGRSHVPIGLEVPAFPTILDPNALGLDIMPTLHLCACLAPINETGK